MKRGMVHIYTGQGKGKTTAAIGLAVRAAAYEKKIYIIQFLKGRKSGELDSLKRFPNITIKRPNTNNYKFYYQMDQKEKERLYLECRETLQDLWIKVREEDYEIIIIDEIMGLLANKILTVKELIGFIEKRGHEQELILTGRDAPDELIEIADYVTEMKMIKHPFQNNIPARKGVEF